MAQADSNNTRNPSTAPRVEAIMAESAGAYLESARRWQRHVASLAAGLPRDAKTYRRFLDNDPLMFRVQHRPEDVSLCWPIIRELCAWRRFARTRAGRLHTWPSMRETAAILIRAELLRLALANTPADFALAAE